MIQRPYPLRHRSAEWFTDMTREALFRAVEMEQMEGYAPSSAGVLQSLVVDHHHLAVDDARAEFTAAQDGVTRSVALAGESLRMAMVYITRAISLAAENDGADGALRVSSLLQSVITWGEGGEVG